MMPRSDWSRLVGMLIAVVLISGFNLFYFDVASADITIDGETVHVETDGYTVQFDCGVIAHIYNKHTDKDYTPGMGGEGWTGLLKHRRFWNDANISTREATLISAKNIDPLEAELLYRQGGTDIRLFIAVEPHTNDLLIEIEGVSDTPGVIGMQWGCENLEAKNLKVIAPVDGGRIIDANTQETYLGYPYPGSGAGWEAQLAIVQGEGGGFYVRNTDNTLQFKHFLYGRERDGFALNFGTHNQAPFDTHTAAKSHLWRFNTYAGDWRVPAWKYRDWMEHAFDARRLSDMPPWVKDITLFFGGASFSVGLTDTVFLDELAKLVDPTRTLFMIKEWSSDQEWSRDPLNHLPIYEPMPELQNFVEVAKRHGFRLILYTVMHGFSVENPLYPEFMQYQYRDTWTGEQLGWKWDDLTHRHRHASINPASSAFRKILVSQLKAVWEEYSIDAFFLDASHVAINDANGLIDGLNAAQGNALLHKELAEAMPGVVLGGERLHEVTFAHESFATRPLLTTKIEPHPISAFLFSPFTHAIGQTPINPDEDPVLHQQILDYGEIWSIMPSLRAWKFRHLHGVETHNLLEMARNWQHKYGLDADVNGDGIVNILDLTVVGQNIGRDSYLNIETDINGDGIVNVLDLIIVSNMFGR